METPQQTVRTIDVTGLPDKAIEAVQAIVEVLRGQVTTPRATSAEDWNARFDAWMREVVLRASRYPAGFVVDDSREAIYEGRGE
jgi:hypothetical protein